MGVGHACKLCSVIETIECTEEEHACKLCITSSKKNQIYEEGHASLCACSGLWGCVQRIPRFVILRAVHAQVGGAACSALSGVWDRVRCMPRLLGRVQAREAAETEEELVLLRMQEREDALAARAVATELLCACPAVLFC